MSISPADATTALTAIFRSAPSEAELAAFQSLCDTQDFDSAVATTVDSDGADAARSVISFYQVFYGRQPDPAGLDFWTGQLESGNVTLNTLADTFASESEFNERFGDRTPTEIVFAQYRNVLGREPDFEGLTFWTEQVSSGNLSLSDLGRFFATSDEGQATFDPFIDALLVDAATDGNGAFDSDESLFAVDVTDGGTGNPGPATGEPIRLADQDGNSVAGGSGSEVFEAETGDLVSATRLNGGGGNDVLAVFNEGQGIAVSPRMQNVETVVWTEQTNDLNSVADNNVGGYSNGNSVEVDVELDAGRITGVTRWEDFDSRADLVIEDARDNDDIDGTFTGDLEVAMVSTDPGNVDYAIYFDDPVNTSTNNDSIFIEVIDQNNSNTFSAGNVNNTTPGSLEDARLDNFAFILNGERVDVVLDTVNDSSFFGPAATYTDLLNAINDALGNATLADGTAVSSLVTAGFGGTFFENIGNDNDGAGANAQVFGRQIVLDGNAGVSLADAGPGDFTVTQLGEPADIAASVRAQNVVNEELIRINVDLDDVGKGSTGGDLLIGAMSVGRQDGDDRTSDSLGIQQFDIEVDRSSNLQTINSTNNSLEVVNIENGQNNGPNNTTTAVDDFENSGNGVFGDLTVRGRANPDQDRDIGDFPTVLGRDGTIATDGAMPGAVPQHNDFGLSDVRVVDASTLRGSLDLTAELTDEILEKYLDISDVNRNGEADDVDFIYNLGTNDDELLINASDSALIDAGTASREDFNLFARGNAGDDTIVVNVGQADKRIDGQGQDYYVLGQANGEGWYVNQVAANAAEIDVEGGTGNDSIWTYGYGDARIRAGDGQDVVYTDNSGTLELPQNLLTRISRNIDEHEQIDYRIGAAWTFNDDNGGNDDNDDDEGFVANLTGSTNSALPVATPTAARVGGTVYESKLTVSFFGAEGDDDTAYTSTVTLPANLIATNGRITEQSINQAIKLAVNSDPVLNKVLEAVDGPGQSLAIYSKIDGDFDREDLQIDVTEEVTTNGNTTTTLFEFGAGAYDTTDDSANVDFQNFGGESQAESDNRIIIDADGDADVTVLSTNDDDDDDDDDNGILNGESNETLVFQAGNFGVETIFNFDAGNGDNDDRDDEDRFVFQEIDFSSSANFTNGAANVSNNSISIIEESGALNSRAEVEDLFDGAATAAGAPTQHIVIVYDDNDNNGPGLDDTPFDSSDNTGRVYLVEDTSGGAANARLLGDINLIGTDWDSLNFDNFA